MSYNDWSAIKRYSVSLCILILIVFVGRCVELMTGYDLQYVIGTFVGYGCALTVYWKEIKGER